MGIMLVKAKEKVGTGTHKKENLEKERGRKNEKSGKKGRSGRERGKRENGLGKLRSPLRVLQALLFPKGTCFVSSSPCFLT